MELYRPGHEILSEIDTKKILQSIEIAGRTCYKSESKITQDSAENFVRMLIRRGHLSVLEHEKITVKFLCDRGVSHELVRHRIASFSQESTRYCNYNKKGIAFVIPFWVDLAPGELKVEWKGGDPFFDMDLSAPMQSGTVIWMKSMAEAERRYNQLSENGWRPEQARSVLPNSLKTEIVVTANLREWRLIFDQRTSKAAHPQMREIMDPLLEELKMQLPAIFDDINEA